MNTDRRVTDEGLAGPHNSRLANAVDPRVDSDLDPSRNAGLSTTGAGYSGGTGTTRSGTTTGAGFSATGTTQSGTTTAGPHTSNLANKLDPTVDSDLDGRRNIVSSNRTSGAHGNTNTSTSGGISTSTNAGPHNSNIANKLDPRVDSDLDGRGNTHGAAKGGIFGAPGSHATPGSGTAQNTAGPHNSDMANKLDPRVDSDLDGSTTFGGNRTHG